MKNARWMLAGFSVLITVLSFTSLSGCLVGDYRGDYRGDNRGERHYYRDGSWYRHSLSGPDIIVSALFIGALIESLPPRHTTVVIEGNSYYHDDSHYYKRSPRGGYVVVQEPAKVQHKSKSYKGKNDGREERGGDTYNEDNRGEHR
jgi:hypothetical protein